MTMRLDLERSAWLALALLIGAACSSSDPDTETDTPASSGGSSSGSGGSSSTAGSSSSSGAKGGAGGSGTVGSTGAKGGSSGAGTAGSSGAASSTGGSGGSSAGSPNVGPPPGPTEDGLAIYTVECEGESSVCHYPEAACLGIYLDEGGVGYACSNQCNTVDDCSDAPSGAEAEVGCVQFTSAKRCVLVCYNGGVESACPDGMGCYRYPNSPIGYCLYL
jgi:hypothetical protein